MSIRIGTLSSPRFFFAPRVAQRFRSYTNWSSSKLDPYPSSGDRHFVMNDRLTLVRWPPPSPP
eukprot:3151495-Pyramimonas_sp.AAC.1